VGFNVDLLVKTNELISIFVTMAKRVKDALEWLKSFLVTAALLGFSFRMPNLSHSS